MWENIYYKKQFADRNQKKLENVGKQKFRHTLRGKENEFYQGVKKETASEPTILVDQ